MKTSSAIYKLFLAIGFWLLAFAGCKKEDTTPPVITLKGANPVYCILTIGTYTEAGATATDDKDGDLTSSIKITGSPNMNLAGSYTVTYTVSDAAGNTSALPRTVIVYNQASLLLTHDSLYLSSGVNYSVKDSIASTGAVNYYSQTVSFSTTVNYGIQFSMFAGDTNNTMITAKISAVDSSITIPSQLVNNISSSPADFHTFQGTGFFHKPNGTKIYLHFFDSNTTAGTNTEIYEWFN